MAFGLLACSSPFSLQPEVGTRAARGTSVSLWVCHLIDLSLTHLAGLPSARCLGVSFGRFIVALYHRASAGGYQPHRRRFPVCDMPAGA